MTDATGEPVLSFQELMEREKARRLQEAAAAIERDMEQEFAELTRIAAKYNLRVTAADGSVIVELASGVPAPQLTPVLPEPPPTKERGFDGTLGGLIVAFQAHPESRYARLQYQVRLRHDQMLRRIFSYYGQIQLFDIKASVLTAWYDDWKGDGKISVAHAFIAQLKALFVFGSVTLEDSECIRLLGIARAMRFEMPRPRDERLSPEQAIAIRRKAYEMGKPSMALAQAFQTELGLLQKDVIGEWVPETEPGESDIHYEGFKWLRGLSWEQIDSGMVLRRKMGGHGKTRPVQIEVGLQQFEMIREEMDLLAQRDPNNKRQGPLIICEATDRPWNAGEFRRWWRKVADKAGVPKGIKNMDARPKGPIGSGPITKTGAQAPAP